MRHFPSKSEFFQLLLFIEDLSKKIQKMRHFSSKFKIFRLFPTFALYPGPVIQNSKCLSFSVKIRIFKFLLAGFVSQKLCHFASKFKIFWPKPTTFRQSSKSLSFSVKMGIFPIFAIASKNGFKECIKKWF